MARASSGTIGGCGPVLRQRGVCEGGWRVVLLGSAAEDRYDRAGRYWNHYIFMDVFDPLRW
eukprot:4901722-Alexandrium_andersonii.AAC.1